MVKRLNIYLFLMNLLHITLISQGNIDLNGIWLGYDYKCSGNNTIYTLEYEVFKITQNEGKYVSAYKCIGDDCVPAGFTSWSGQLVDSVISGNFVIGSPNNPASSAVPVNLFVVNDTLITSNFVSHFVKIDCRRYLALSIPWRTNYVDCKLCSEDFEIPNVFTPNSDGINDNWILFLRHEFKLSYVEIYNRWGQIEKIIKRKKTDAERTCSWDGLSANGLECTSGVYYYIVKYFDDFDKPKYKKGTINLFR